MRDLETEHLTGRDGISITSADGIVWYGELTQASGIV